MLKEEDHGTKLVGFMNFFNFHHNQLLIFKNFDKLENNLIYAEPEKVLR